VKGVRKMPKGKGTYGSQVGRPPKKQNEDTAGYDVPTSDARGRNEEYGFGGMAMDLVSDKIISSKAPDLIKAPFKLQKHLKHPKDWIEKGDTVESLWQEHVKEGYWDERNKQIESWNLGKVGEGIAKYYPNPYLRGYIGAARTAQNLYEGNYEWQKRLNRKSPEEMRGDFMKVYAERKKEVDDERIEKENEPEFTWESGDNPQEVPTYDAGGRVQQYALGDKVPPAQEPQFDPKHAGSRRELVSPYQHEDYGNVAYKKGGKVKKSDKKKTIDPELYKQIKESLLDPRKAKPIPLPEFPPLKPKPKKKTRRQKILDAAKGILKGKKSKKAVGDMDKDKPKKKSK
jgi:hypothetical protein